jgi:hypothetical protein
MLLQPQLSMFSQVHKPPKAEEVSPFAHDKTTDLIKKFFIYKMMGSNLFINYSLAGVHLSYKLFGTKFTNALIESTSGAIFTGGVSLQSVKKVQQFFRERQTGTIACYVVEGLCDVDNRTLDNFCKFTIRAIQQMAGEHESHFALKLTAYASMCLMEKLSCAQEQFALKILEVKYDALDKSVLSREALIANLAKHGIKDYSQSDLDRLVKQVSDKDGNMLNINRYIGGHVCSMYGEPNSLLNQIMVRLGGLTSQDISDTKLFIDRIKRISDEAAAKNCKLYVDAEQTYI